MDQYQFEISPNEIISFDNLELIDEYTYLYVFHADKIPPHIGVVANGLFYSVKANSIDLDLSISKINSLIERKKICTLIFEINRTPQTSIKQLFNDIDGKINTGETCLTPISNAYYINGKHTKIGELLSDLDTDRNVVKTYGAFLPKNFKGIHNYSSREINERINKLRG
jgi:hypothetical protein